MIRIVSIRVVNHWQVAGGDWCSRRRPGPCPCPWPQCSGARSAPTPAAGARDGFASVAQGLPKFGQIFARGFRFYRHQSMQKNKTSIHFCSMFGIDKIMWLNFQKLATFFMAFQISVTERYKINFAKYWEMFIKYYDIIDVQKTLLAELAKYWFLEILG